MVQKQTYTVHMHVPECQYLLSGMVGSQGSSDSLLSVGSYNYTMEVIRILTKSPSNRVLIRDLKRVLFVENTFSTKCLGSGSQDDQNGTHFALERSVSLTLPLATSLNSFVMALSNYGNHVKYMSEYRVTNEPYTCRYTRGDFFSYLSSSTAIRYCVHPKQAIV